MDLNNKNKINELNNADIDTKNKENYIEKSDSERINTEENNNGFASLESDCFEEERADSQQSSACCSRKNSEKKFVKEQEKKTITSKFLDKFPSLSIKTYKITVIVYTVICIALAIFRVNVIEKSVESPGFVSENAYYKLDNTWYTKTFLILCIVLGVVALVTGVLSRKTGFWVNKRSNAFVFVSSLTGFCMVGCSGFFVYRVALSSDAISTLDYLSIILMLLTGVYFVMDAVGFISKKARPFCFVGVVIFSVVRLLSRFLELHDVQHYSSNEYLLVGLVCLLLFFTTNARGNIDGKPSVAYPFFGLLSILFIWCYALPEIYILLYEPYYVDSTFIFCIIDATLGMYVCAKLLSVKESMLLFDRKSI